MVEKTPNKKEESAKPIKAQEDQPEYQEKIMFLVSTTAQTAILIWCLIVLSLGYVKLPSRMFGVDIPDQPRIDNTFAAALLGNILAGWGISVGAGSSGKKKKKEDEQMSARNAGGQQTIVIKQPIELITKQPTATRLNDLDRI
tara:strand:+ start:520 stop:948 length:429 start_codon:yes stop_codon:yes gene_type:complete